MTVFHPTPVDSGMLMDFLSPPTPTIALSQLTTVFTKDVCPVPLVFRL